MKVLKFGGTSMANAQNILKAAEIALRQSRAVIVVSAPGKQHSSDEKITDMLINCYNERLRCGRCDIPFAKIRDRFLRLAEQLKMDRLLPYLEQIYHDINAGASYMYTISRGEYLSSLIMRHILGCEFVDATELIRFDSFGVLDAKYTFDCIKKRLDGCKKVVVPGFYGAMPNGEIRTFSRGGADVSGAIVASAIGAKVYENWTDVDGIYFCSATEICSPLRRLSYRQAHQLCYMGAHVLHPDSLPYLAAGNIKTLIKNTFNPLAKGTLIDASEQNPNGTAKAFSGRRGFRAIGFYELGLKNEKIASITLELIKRGAKIVSVLAAVDSVTFLIDGDVVEKTELEPIFCKDLAVFSIIGGNKRTLIKQISALDVDYEIIAADCSSNGILLAVDQGDYEQVQTKLCMRLFKGAKAIKKREKREHQRQCANGAEQK